jgi:AcrR family transcriptional regulator
MPRWPEDSRARLVDAAMSLFGEHGYSGTTIDDIAARAGVTARTFFRHFADKEEVLFADDDEMLPLMLATIVDGSDPVSAEALMQRVLGTLAEQLEPQRAALTHRQAIIDSEVSLSGRELAKQARWQHAIAEALVARGFAEQHAGILAAIGFALFSRTLHAWLADTAGPPLATRIRDALPTVRTVLDEVSAS